MSLPCRPPWAGLAVLLLLVAPALAGDGFPEPRGPYLGQEPPGTEPTLFAPGIVSTGLGDRDVAISPDGNEIYFCQATNSWGIATIMMTRLVDGRWTPPEAASFCDLHYMDFEPCLSPDGRRLYFLSNRPDPEAGETEGGDQDIWYVERAGDGWGEAKNLGPPVNSDGPEFYPSLTRDNTLYFTRGGAANSAIYRSRWVDGAYTEPERLPEQVNASASQFNAYVSPDESWLLIPMAGREESLGGVDYFVSFRDADDNWVGPIHVAAISSEDNREWSASLSPDGKYLFFMSSRTIGLDDPPRTQREILELDDRPGNGASDIYWVDASVIERLRPR